MAENKKHILKMMRKNRNLMNIIHGSPKLYLRLSSKRNTGKTISIISKTEAFDHFPDDFRFLESQDTKKENKDAQVVSDKSHRKKQFVPVD